MIRQEYIDNIGNSWNNSTVEYREKTLNRYAPSTWKPETINDYAKKKWSEFSKATQFRLYKMLIKNLDGRFSHKSSVRRVE